METISNQNTQSPDTKTITQLLSPWVRHLGLLTTILAVYGYCVMQGVANALHIEGGSLWGAPSDVLHYAFLGIVAVFNRFPDPSNLGWLGKILSQWIFWFSVVCIMFLAWMAFIMDKSPDAYAARNHRLKNNWLTRFMQRKVRNLAVWQWALVITSSLTIPIMLLAAWFGLLVTAAVILLFGLLGISTGLAHVADQKPANPYCITAPAPQDLTAQAVRCVQVRWQADGQTQSETGILITSTSNYALLIKPGSAYGLRVPLNGHAILEAVSQLETAPPTPKHPLTN